MTEPLVDLTIDDPAWDLAVPDLPQISESAADLAIKGADLAPEDFSISLLAASDARIQQLNATFRDKHAATNVLSWPAHELAPQTPGERPLLPPRYPIPGRAPLGDVAIALQTCVHEAKIAEIPLKNHVTHLILHGCLHLLGYDHQADADAARMEGIEITALAKIGIPDPYA